MINGVGVGLVVIYAGVVKKGERCFSTFSHLELCTITVLHKLREDLRLDLHQGGCDGDMCCQQIKMKGEVPLLLHGIPLTLALHLLKGGLSCVCVRDVGEVFTMRKQRCQKEGTVLQFSSSACLPTPQKAFDQAKEVSFSV